MEPYQFPAPVISFSMVHSEFCGQVPSDYFHRAEFLVEVGTDLMSFNVDTVLKATGSALETERQLGYESRRASGAHAA